MPPTSYSSSEEALKSPKYTLAQSLVMCYNIIITHLLNKFNIFTVIKGVYIFKSIKIVCVNAKKLKGVKK